MLADKYLVTGIQKFGFLSLADSEPSNDWDEANFINGITYFTLVHCDLSYCDWQTGRRKSIAVNINVLFYLDVVIYVVLLGFYYISILNCVCIFRWIL